MMQAATRPAMGRNLSGKWRQDFGAIIRDLRLGKEMTQQELADLMGVRTTMVSGIETGVNSFPPDRIERFVEILGLDPVSFTTTYLRHTNPWAYLGLGLARDDAPAVRKELRRTDERVNKRKGPRKDV